MWVPPGALTLGARHPALTPGARSDLYEGYFIFVLLITNVIKNIKNEISNLKIMENSDERIHRLSALTDPGEEKTTLVNL